MERRDFSLFFIKKNMCIIRKLYNNIKLYQKKDEHTFFEHDYQMKNIFKSKMIVFNQIF